MTLPKTIYTIGHSNHPLGHFLSLLKDAGITAVADVRSKPYSRRNPQFNREPLKDALKAQGIAYVPMDDQLGGQPKDPSLWRGARPDYERIARSPAFCEGLDRIEKGSADQNIALMCAEHAPLDCHRCLLVARELKQRGTPVVHILRDGTLQPHDETEQDLLKWAKIAEDMFDALRNAYRMPISSVRAGCGASAINAAQPGATCGAGLNLFSRTGARARLQYAASATRRLHTPHRHACAQRTHTQTYDPTGVWA